MAAGVQPAPVVVGLTEYYLQLVLRETPQLKALYTTIRNKDTPRDKFVLSANRITRLLIEESLSLLPSTPVTVQTPCGPFEGCAMPPVEPPPPGALEGLAAAGHTLPLDLGLRLAEMLGADVPSPLPNQEPALAVCDQLPALRKRERKPWNRMKVWTPWVLPRTMSYRRLDPARFLGAAPPRPLGIDGAWLPVTHVQASLSGEREWWRAQRNHVSSERGVWLYYAQRRGHTGPWPGATPHVQPHTGRGRRAPSGGAAEGAWRWPGLASSRRGVMRAAGGGLLRPAVPRGEDPRRAQPRRRGAAGAQHRATLPPHAALANPHAIAPFAPASHV